jgi:transcriptional regulator with PAS, ATPase and Fis domain
MDDVPAALKDAWERTVGGADRLEALRGARDLKEALAEYEARLARDALANGETWETIGTALGISRQAAWERLRRAITADIEADRERVKAARDRLAAKKRSRS